MYALDLAISPGVGWLGKALSNGLLVIRLANRMATDLRVVG